MGHFIINATLVPGDSNVPAGAKVPSGAEKSWAMSRGEPWTVECPVKFLTLAGNHVGEEVACQPTLGLADFSQMMVELRQSEWLLRVEHEMGLCLIGDEVLIVGLKKRKRTRGLE